MVGLVVYPFYDRDLKKLDPFLLKQRFLIGGCRSLDISLFRLSVVDFERLFGKIKTNVFAILIHILLNQSKHVTWIHLHLVFFFLLLTVLFYRKRGKDLLHVTIGAYGAVDDTGGILLFEGGTVLEPALKFVTF